MPLARISNQKGFTFVEVMVTLVILSVGIVAIFKSLLISLDQIDYLTNRLYASTAIDNIYFTKEHMLKNFKELSIDLGNTLEIDRGSKTIQCNQKIEISEIESYPDLFHLDVALSWNEGNRRISLQRSGYIHDPLYEYKSSNP